MRSKPVVPSDLLASLMSGKFDCKFADMKATLFSNFPDRFLRESIIPKLDQRGIEVVRVSVPKNAESVSGAGAGSEIVLFMHEMASHNDDKVVRALAHKEGLPMVCLSRKASSWDERLPLLEQAPQHQTQPDPKPKPDPKPDPDFSSVAATAQDTDTGDKVMPDNTTRTVPNDVLEAMLRHMMQLHAKNTKYEDMVPELRQYWTNELANGAQLYSYLGNVLRRADCPEFYKQWVAAGRPAGEPSKPKRAKRTDMDTHTQTKTKMRGVRGMPEEDLEKMLRLVMTQRNSGKAYGAFLNQIQKFWPDGGGPRDADQLSKLAATCAHSPRAPTWYKAWFKQAKKRPGSVATKATKTSARKPVARKPADDAELAKIYAEENEALKKRVAALQAKPDVKHVKEQLIELFSSCRKLVELGAMDVEQTLRMAMEYLERD